jgi:hypothetical protein
MSDIELDFLLSNVLLLEYYKYYILNHYKGYSLIEEECTFFFFPLPNLRTNVSNLTTNN